MPDSSTEDRAFIAEYGFSLFVEKRWPSTSYSNHEELEGAAAADARRRVMAFKDNTKAIPNELTEPQTWEVREIARRLEGFFFRGSRAVRPRPIFSGCGFVDRSEGDIVRGATLFEVKTVERPFRGNDVRQLITYCALNALAPKCLVNKIGVYNPRRGVYFELDLDTVTREISGKMSGELFEEIYQAIASGAISR
jgi:hypothetical protein